jgi:hypothetical protein
MTKDEILRMARDSGCVDPMVFFGAYERFAKLVAAAEREACLKAAAAVDDEGSHNQRIMKRRIRAAIRARGQA